MKNQSSNHPKEAEFHVYLDNELSISEKAAFEAHIQHCEACQVLLDQTEILFHQIDRMPLQEMSADLSTDIIDKIKQQKRVEPYIKGTVWVQGFVTVGLIVGFLSFLSPESFQQFASGFPGNFFSDITSTMEYLAISFSEPFQDVFMVDFSQLPLWDFSFRSIFTTNLLIALLVSSGLLWVIGNRMLLLKYSISQSTNGG